MARSAELIEAEARHWQRVKDERDRYKRERDDLLTVLLSSRAAREAMFERIIPDEPQSPDTPTDQATQAPSGLKRPSQ